LATRRAAKRSEPKPPRSPLRNAAPRNPKTRSSRSPLQNRRLRSIHFHCSTTTLVWTGSPPTTAAARRCCLLQPPVRPAAASHVPDARPRHPGQTRPGRHRSGPPTRLIERRRCINATGVCEDRNRGRRRAEDATRGRCCCAVRRVSLNLSCLLIYRIL